jgi:hypothetical protein
MMAQNATVRPTALQVRDVVQVAIEADGNGNTRRSCCAGRAWDAEEEEMSDVRISGGVSGSVKRERERVQSCLMGLAQQQDGRASALSQGRGYGFGNEEGEQYEEEEEEAEGGAAEAPDVPRERERMGSSLSGSVSKGWKKAFGRMR